MMLRAYRQQTYALLRIVTGFLFVWHGMSKLFGFPMPVPAEAPPFVLYVAGPIELIGGALVMIGLLTHWSAFLCSGLMAAAYWMAHGFKAPLPVQNQGELAVLYCFIFLFIAAAGPGIWSVDGESVVQRAGIDNLMTNAVALLCGSAVAAIWGYSYIDTHNLERLFAGENSTFQMARLALLLGGLGFLLGLGLLVAALSRRK